LEQLFQCVVQRSTTPFCQRAEACLVGGGSCNSSSSMLNDEACGYMKVKTQAPIELQLRHGFSCTLSLRRASLSPFPTWICCSRIYL